jgi:hypothetical protein
MFTTVRQTERLAPSGKPSVSVAYPEISVGGGGSTKSVEDSGQREWSLGAVAP